MGRRYTAILRDLFVDPLLVDIDEPIPDGFDSVIIATPTKHHVAHIEQFLQYDVPILCEKPVATSLRGAKYAVKAAEEAKVNLTMVNQYAYLKGKPTPFATLTAYDYFNHGRDGLAWDCISIIALAKNKVVLGEGSPIWSCHINGEEMRLSDMDHAYVSMIKAWLAGHHDKFGSDYILDAHDKVEAYLEVRQ